MGWAARGVPATPNLDPHSHTPTPHPWATQDQFDVLERHTQWGLDLLDRYVKFVKERTEVEQTYAKQLR